MRSLLLSACIAIVAAGNARAEAPITAAALAPDGKQVVLGSQRGVEVRSWPALQVTGTLATELTHIHDLSFAADGQTLLVAGGAPAEEGAVEVLSWPDGKRVRRVAGHEDVVYRVAWSPDGTEWVTAGADGICQTFAAGSGERLVRYEGHSRAVLTVAYLPDGKTIASAGVDQTLRLWDRARGQHLRTLDHHVGTVNALAIRPGGTEPSPTVVATVSEDRTVRLWQPSIGRLMRFARLPSIPRAVAWSDDGDRLLVGCNDGRIRVFDPDSMDVMSDQQGLPRRIHELLLDARANRLLLAGESGCRAGPSPFAEPK